eukprot:381855_1
MTVYQCLLGVLLLLHDANSNCKWNKLDLSDLQRYNITCAYGKWALEYTPCKNHLTCEGSEEDGEYMVVQYNTGNNRCAVHTAEWDNGVTQPIETKNDTLREYEYRFEYENGLVGAGCANGRHTFITFICDLNAKPFEEVTCGEWSQDNGVCRYWIEIHTHLACDNRPLTNVMNSISTGTLLIIVFIVVFILYCITGYMMNGFKSDTFQDCKNNTPHYTFWIHLPMLVKMGCIVTFECITGRMHQDVENETHLMQDDNDYQL